jgi:hypothetical protein
MYASSAKLPQIIHFYLGWQFLLILCARYCVPVYNNDVLCRDIRRRYENKMD